MTLRRLLFWLHLSVGLVAGLLIGFLALTGAIISFQPQLISLAERGVRVTPVAGAACVLPSTLLANAQAASMPPLTGVTLFADPRRPAQIAMGSDGAVLLADGCSGRILGPGANRLRVALTTVRELHHQAAFQGVRHRSWHALTNAAALGFVFLTLSGLYVWFPRQLTWQHLRPSLWFRRGLGGRAREWNLHSVAGFWLCLPLFLIAGTGVIMAYPWANALLYRAAGDAPPPPRTEGGRPAAMGAEGAPKGRRERAEPRQAGAAPGNAEVYAVLDAPIARALAHTPTPVSVTLRLPSPHALRETAALTFQIANEDRGQSMNRDQLTLATADATTLKWEPFAKASRGRRWRVGARYLHTGELFGAPGQAVALVAVLGALLLVWTGFSLALRRLAAFLRRRRRPRTSAATDAGRQAETVRVG